MWVLACNSYKHCHTFTYSFPHVTRIHSFPYICSFPQVTQTYPLGDTRVHMCDICMHFLYMCAIYMKPIPRTSTYIVHTYPLADTHVHICKWGLFLTLAHIFTRTPSHVQETFKRLVPVCVHMYACLSGFVCVAYGSLRGVCVSYIYMTHICKIHLYKCVWDSSQW